MSGILELAEQIDTGEGVDSHQLYVLVWSEFTVSGLIIGTVVVQHFGVSNMLIDPKLKIVRYNVHEQLDWVATFHLHSFRR